MNAKEILISCKTMANGMNLRDLKDVVLTTSDFQPDEMIARAHRAGRRGNPGTCHIISGTNKVEETAIGIAKVYFASRLKGRKIEKIVFDPSKALGEAARRAAAAAQPPAPADQIKVGDGARSRRGRGRGKGHAKGKPPPIPHASKPTYLAPTKSNGRVPDPAAENHSGGVDLEELKRLAEINIQSWKARCSGDGSASSGGMDLEKE